MTSWLEADGEFAFFVEGDEDVDAAGAVGVHDVGAVDGANPSGVVVAVCHDGDEGWVIHNHR